MLKKVGINWISAANNGVDLKTRIFAGRELFAGLNYYNPPGGSKHCLHSKLAACDLRDHGIMIQV